MKAIGGVWKKVSALEADADRLAKVADGLDGRRIRKEIFVAITFQAHTTPSMVASIVIATLTLHD